MNSDKLLHAVGWTTKEDVLQLSQIVFLYAVTKAALPEKVKTLSELRTLILEMSVCYMHTWARKSATPREPFETSWDWCHTVAERASSCMLRMNQDRKYFWSW